MAETIRQPIDLTPESLKITRPELEFMKEYIGDPKEKLIAIQMIQTPTGSNSAYRHAFRNLTYAALTESEPAR